MNLQARRNNMVSIASERRWRLITLSSQTWRIPWYSAWYLYLRARIKKKVIQDNNRQTKNDRGSMPIKEFLSLFQHVPRHLFCAVSWHRFDSYIPEKKQSIPSIILHTDSGLIPIHFLIYLRGKLDVGHSFNISEGISQKQHNRNMTDPWNHTGFSNPKYISLSEASLQRFVYAPKFIFSSPWTCIRGNYYKMGLV